MKKCFWAICFFVFFVNCCFAIETDQSDAIKNQEPAIHLPLIRLPSAEILRERLSNGGYIEFAENTKIISYLGEKTLSTKEISHFMVEAMGNYRRYLEGTLLPQINFDNNVDIENLLKQHNLNPQLPYNLIELLLKDSANKKEIMMTKVSYHFDSMLSLIQPPKLDEF